jgi:hypothetical protein
MQGQGRLLRPISDSASIEKKIIGAVIIDPAQQEQIRIRQALLSAAQAKEEVYDYVGSWIIFSGWAEQISQEEMLESIARVLLLAGVPPTHSPLGVGRGFRLGKALLSSAANFEGRQEVVGRILRFFASQRVRAAERVPPRVEASNRERAAKGKAPKGQGKGGKGERPVIVMESLTGINYYLSAEVATSSPWDDEERTLDDSVRSSMQFEDVKGKKEKGGGGAKGEKGGKGGKGKKEDWVYVPIKWVPDYIREEPLRSRMKILLPLIHNNLLVPGAHVKKDQEGRPTGVPFLPASYGMRWREEARAGLSQEERDADSGEEDEQEREDEGDDGGVSMDEREESAKTPENWEERDDEKERTGQTGTEEELALKNSNTQETDTGDSQALAGAASSSTSTASKLLRPATTSPTKARTSHFTKQTGSRSDKGLWGTAGRRQKI